MWLELLVGVAVAQDPALDLQRVVPVGASHGFLVTPTARQLPGRGYSLGLLGHGAWGPFVQGRLEDGSIVETAEVRRILAGHVHGAFGLSDGVELSLTVPAIQSVQRIASDITTGDVRLGVGLRPLSEDVIGIALETFISFPTGGRDVTRRVVMPGARLALSRSLGPLHLGLTGGARLLPISGYLPEAVGVTHEALLGGGVAWEGVDGLRVNMEATGAVLGPNGRFTRAADYRSALITPVEAIASVRVGPLEGVELVVGGGRPVVKAVATPDWRAFAGLTLRGRVEPAAEPVVAVAETPPPVTSPDDALPVAVEHRGRPDRDRDGLFDDEDLCPLAAEDHDGFLDHDGCPELDNDGDGIPDAQDICPVDPEQYNGEKDHDGCPDDLDVVLTETRIHILERVHFAPGSATVDARSTPVLTAVLQTLLDHPELSRVRVEGHTDDTGDPDDNLRLSGQRAAAVRAWLVERGVAAERLQSEGFGPWSPAVPNDSPGSRERNRRVEFHVLQRREPEGSTEEPPSSE